MSKFIRREQPQQLTAAVALVAMIATVTGIIGLYYTADFSGPAGAYGPGTFTDKRDGKTYKTVVIGGQRWMAENLNYPVISSWCYDNDDSNCGRYGRLYNWKAAKKACPTGWRLPRRRDWVKLGLSATTVDRWPLECWDCRFDVLCERDFEQSKPECMNCPCFGERWIEGGIEDWYDAGDVLKAKSGWNGEYGGGGADDFGFLALPGGYRDAAGRFYGIGDTGNWWSATRYTGGGNLAYYRNMTSDHWDMKAGGGDKADGYSVRCVQNGFATR